MTQALILVNGVAASDDNLPINNLVTLANQGNGGELTYAWTITYQPPGAADALSAPSAATTNLTPRKEGNYRIQLVVNASLPDERVATAIVGVRQLVSDLSQPAAGETTELGPQGWAVAMDQVVRRVSELNADPGRIVVVNTDSSPIGTPVIATTTAVLKAGLPDPQVLISVASAASVALSVAARSFLLVLDGTVDGGPVALNGLCYARFYGNCGVIPLASISGAPSVGDLLYLDAGATYTSILPVLANYRAVGVYLGVNPLAGTLAMVSVNLGAYTTANAGSSGNILWEWNGTDTSQFLPKVDIGLGAGIAGLTLSVVAGGPNGNLLRAGSTELVAGGVIFPIDFPFPHRYVIEVTYYAMLFTDVTTALNNLCGVTVLANSTCAQSVSLAHGNITAANPEQPLLDFAISAGVPFGPAFALNSIASAQWITGFGGFQTGLSMRYTVNAQRPFVSATPAASITIDGSGANQVTPATYNRVTGSARDVPAYPVAWNGAVLDTIGILIGNGGATTAWTVDIESIRVLRHPADS